MSFPFATSLKNLVTGIFRFPGRSGSIALVMLAASIGASQGSLLAIGAEKPEFSTKEVMELSMKKGLWKKVVAGEASDAEKKQLVELFVALGENKPPKGDEESWKEKTSALVAAAEAVAKGDEDASKKLMEAINCGACHKVHK